MKARNERESELPDTDRRRVGKRVPVELLFVVVIVLFESDGVVKLCRSMTSLSSPLYSRRFSTAFDQVESSMREEERERDEEGFDFSSAFRSF